MNRLAEFIQHHPLLASMAIALALAAVVIELRYRMRGAAALGPMGAVQLINGGALVIDVRSADAFAAGHIIDSRHIQQSDLAAQAESLKKFREKPVLVYCDSGSHSAAAARVLKSSGFGKVVNLRGGLAAWKQDNLPTVMATKSPSKHKSGSKGDK